MFDTIALSRRARRGIARSQACQCPAGQLLAERELVEALTFCDMTTSPDGEHVQVHNRLAEIHDRYGSGHLVSRSIRRATPLILEAVSHVHAQAVRA